MLSARGRDYLKATAATVAIVSIAGPAILAALTLSLAVMAGISLVLLKYGLRGVRVSVEPTHIRVFKRQAASGVIRVGPTTSGFARVSSIVLKETFGLKCEVGHLDRGVAELTTEPQYAGWFDGMKAVVTVTDALGLYINTQEVPVGLSVESLPRSLLSPDVPVPVSPVVQGEVSTGGRGSGQELYSVEPYAPGSDAKDVMWKRLARSEEGVMYVRVREASARARVVLLFAVGDATQEEVVKRTDLASEAVTQLGKKFTSLGVAVEVGYLRDGRLSSATASNSVELANAVTRLWSKGPDASDPVRTLGRADLLIIGPEMLNDARVSGLLDAKPVLLLREEGQRSSPTSYSGKIFVFTGSEDLTPLAEVLLEG